MRVFITGASGFVGRALTATLMAQGHEVIAHSRTPQSDLGSRCVACGFDETAALTTALKGVDVLIHAAGRKTGTRVADFERDNHVLPLHMYAQAKAAGVGRFVFLSTATALLDLQARSQPLMDEQTAPNTGLNWAYARAKARAEAGLLRERTGPSVTIVRPCLIWGGAAMFHTRLATGMFRLMGSGGYGHTTVHIDNFCDFMAAVLVHEGGQQIFHPQDSGQLPLVDFISGLSAALGTPTPGRAPDLPTRLAAAGLGLAKTVSGGRRDFGLQAVRHLFGREFTTTDAHSRQALGWHPPRSVDAALASTAPLQP